MPQVGNPSFRFHIPFIYHLEKRRVFKIKTPHPFRKSWIPDNRIHAIFLHLYGTRHAFFLSFTCLIALQNNNPPGQPRSWGSPDASATPLNLLKRALPVPVRSKRRKLYHNPFHHTRKNLKSPKPSLHLARCYRRPRSRSSASTRASMAGCVEKRLVFEDFPPMPNA